VQSYLRIGSSLVVSVLLCFALLGCSGIQSDSGLTVTVLASASAGELTNEATPVERKAEQKVERKADPAEPPVKVARSNKAAADKTGKTEKTDKAVSEKSASPQELITKAKKKPLNPNPTIPRVLLSDAHKKTCRKLVGDTIDPIEVTDIEGTPQILNDLLSDQLTVLIFWSQNSIAALEQFRRIPVDVLATFASYRVKVIAVNVGGNLARTRIMTGDAADKIVSLLDSDSKLFHQFAESRVPRTYLLDKDGHILWFDIEYSQSTVRSLSNALTFFLTKK